jgi:(S)-mandelate dehydrogenase
MQLSRCRDIDDLRLAAQKRLPGFVFDFVDGGADGQVGVRKNVAVFEDVALIPRVLVDVANRSLATTMFGARQAAPLAIAPTGGVGMLHRDGEIGLARAAVARNIPFTLSTASNVGLEKMRDAVDGRLWMQLYMFKNHDMTNSIVRRADAAGYEALVLTLDTPVAGMRKLDSRHFARPGALTLKSRINTLFHPRWMANVLLRGLPGFPNVEAALPPDQRSAHAARAFLMGAKDQSLEMSDLARFRDMWPRTLLVKGVLAPDDVGALIDHGVDGVILSNHGGRQLDGTVTALEMLPAAVEAARGRIPILIDGGVRRGSDIIKAVALGAATVMIGRATLYGIGAGGEPGACRALEILFQEMDRTLALLGCPDVAGLGSEYMRVPIGFGGLR